jgi:hypothetical protein
MATAKRICKVCGNEYDYCRSFNPSADIFRWNDVACSPEHAAIYFARVEASRKAQEETPVAEVVPEPEAVQNTSTQNDEQEATVVSEEAPTKASKAKKKAKSSNSKN